MSIVEDVAEELAGASVGTNGSIEADVPVVGDGLDEESVGAIVGDELDEESTTTGVGGELDEESTTTGVGGELDEESTASPVGPELGDESAASPVGPELGDESAASPVGPGLGDVSTAGENGPDDDAIAVVAAKGGYASPKNTASAVGVISLRSKLWSAEIGGPIVEELASPAVETSVIPLWNGATGA